mmetsp:Transcript_25437/g.33215  ORF Transcript_25437/g.33215 Transcript_25437/m.33215 type:complete len:471 (-) Transcript_25437:141-1553(-)
MKHIKYNFSRLSVLFVSVFLLEIKLSESFTISPFSIPKGKQQISRQALSSQASFNNDITISSWDTIRENLPIEEKLQSNLILYRDTNGWCPFCERVWLYLLEKNIPFEEKLINLRDKPEWYKEMVPTNLVPAIKYKDSGKVVWESIDIIKDVEENHMDKPLLPSKGEPLYENAMELMDYCSEFLNTTIGFVYNREPSKHEEKRAAFLQGMADIDNILQKQGGPFFLGERFSVIDAMFVPFLERYSVQIPVTSEIKIRNNPDWPHLTRWFQAMDSLPNYSLIVKGDEYSWTAVTSMFMKIFSNGTMDEAATARASRADEAAKNVLLQLEDSGSQAKFMSPDKRILAKIQAATKIVNNREAVIADATSSEPKSQSELVRCKSNLAVDLLLRAAVVLLLCEEEEFDTMLKETGKQLSLSDEAEEILIGARYISQRLCAPRDMGEEAATQLRLVLLNLAEKIVSSSSKASEVVS